MKNHFVLVLVALIFISKNNPSIAICYKSISDDLKVRKDLTELNSSQIVETRIRETSPMAKVLNEIKNGKTQQLEFIIFETHATDEEISIIYDKLLNEKEEERLISYLWIFRRRALPALDTKITALAYSDNQKLRLSTINALSNTSDPGIHDLAISIHAQEEPGIEKSMLWLYENTNCTICRSSAVNLLLEHHIMPDDILNECLFDCEEDIVNAVKNRKHSIKSF